MREERADLSTPAGQVNIGFPKENREPATKLGVHKNQLQI
jgi:hypothetical protein